MILETLGTPDKEKIESIQDEYVAKKMKDACGRLEPFEKVPFEKILSGLEKEGFFFKINKQFKSFFLAYDLMDRMFEIDYKKRITAAEALLHPYLSDMHNPDDEVFKKKLKSFFFKISQKQLLFRILSLNLRNMN